MSHHPFTRKKWGITSRTVTSWNKLRFHPDKEYFNFLISISIFNNSLSFLLSSSNAMPAPTPAVGFLWISVVCVSEAIEEALARSATHYDVTVQRVENPLPSLFSLDEVTEGGIVRIDQQRPLRLCCGFFPESDRKLRGNYYLRRADLLRLSHNLSGEPPGRHHG